MAPRKGKTTKKISPPKEVKETFIDTPPFHIVFPFTLMHKEGKVVKYCYFEAEEHLKKYIIRLNLKKGQFTITPTEPTQV